jgi:hypothetical protein
VALEGLRALASVSPEPPHEDRGLLGFLSNIGSGAKDMAIGLAQLGMGAVNDIVTSPIGTTQDIFAKLLPDALLGGNLDVGPYHTRTGALLSQLPPAIAEDYGRRYGSLLPGGAPASEAYTSMYEDPLSYVLDALTVGTMGAGASSKLGGMAVKGSEEASATAADALARLVEAGVKPRTAAAASTRAGLETLAGERPLSVVERASRALLPAETKALIGDELVTTAQAYNPVTRLSISPIQKALTEPLSALEERVGQLAGRIGALGQTNAPAELISEYGLQSSILKKAQEAGLGRISKPFVSEKAADMAARRFLASTNARFLKSRLKETSKYQEAMVPLIKEAPELAEEGAGYITGLNANLGGRPAEWFTQQEARAGVQFEKRLVATGDDFEATVPVDQLESVLRETEEYVPLRQRAITGEDDISALREDISSQGQVESVTLSRRGDAVYLEDGAHRVEVARELGAPVKIRMADGSPLPASLQTPGALRTAAPMRAAPSEAASAALQAANPIAQRVEAVVEKLRAYQERLLDPEDLVHQRITSADAEADAVNRMVDHLYADLDRRLLHDTPESGVTVEAGSRLVGEARLLDMEKMVDEFDSLQSTPRQVLEETYVPLRLKYGAEWDSEGVSLGNVTDEAARVQDWIAKRGESIWNAEQKPKDYNPLDLETAEQLAREEIAAGNAPRDIVEAAQKIERQANAPTVEQLDDAFRASDQAAPTYFPFMDPEKLKTSDWFTAKKLVGANIYSRDPHLNRMKGVLLQEGSYVRDPVEAFTRRAARGVRAQETFRQMMDVVDHYGRPISKTDDVPLGHVVVAPDLLFLAKRTGFKLEDVLDDLLSKGMDRDGALAEAIKTVMFKNTEDIAKLLEEGNVKMWAVPKVVADRLNDAARYAGFVSGKTRLWHDSVIQAWRGLVLSGSPRWVVNNFLGNTMFGLMQGVKVNDVLRSLGAHFKETVLGRESSFLNELRKLPGYEDVPAGFVGSTVGQYEYAKPGLADSKTYRALARVGQTKPVTWAEHFGRGMRTLNSIVEDSFRSASYLTAAERQLGMGAIRRTAQSFMGAERRIGGIMKAGFDETAAKSAMNEVIHFYGDYGNLGAFERHVLRRWMFPFWSFYKHQAKLLLTFPFEYPARANVLKALADMNNEMIAEYGPVPAWLEGALPLTPPGPQAEYLSTRGANPFSMTFEPWTGMLSPILKVGIEQATGRSLFTGREFTDRDVYTPFGTDQRFRIIRDSEGNIIGAEPVERVAPGLIESLLQQIPQYQMGKEVASGGKTYDTASLIDAFQGTAVINDPETGQPRYPTDLTDKLASLFGANTYDFDLAGYQQSLEEQRQAALAAALSGSTG